MPAATNPYQPPGGAGRPDRFWSLLAAGFAIGFVTSCVVTPLAAVAALSALGSQLSSEFEEVQRGAP